MILQTVFYFVFLNSNFSDTLILPLKGGHVKNNYNKSNFLHEPMEVVIYPAKNFEVTSSSAGKIVAVSKDSESRFSVIVKSDSIYYTYILDTVNVKKGQLVKKAQVIGKLRQPVKESKLCESFPLVFIVSKMQKPINAYKYLVFDKCSQ
jgi:hypothetical protein